MATNSLEIECPECGKIIDINEQISHQLQEETANQKKQLEIKIKKEVMESHSIEIENFKADLAERDKLLLDNKDAEEAKNVQMQEMQHQLDNQAEKMEVEKQKAALKAKAEAMVEYKEMAEELANQKNAQAHNIYQM